MWRSRKWLRHKCQSRLKKSFRLHRQLSLQMEQTRAEALENIATNAEDPIDALLTLEMGAHSFAEEALPIFDRLAVTLDDDLVGRRVTHFRNDLASYLANRGISKSLSPRQEGSRFHAVQFGRPEYFFARLAI